MAILQAESENIEGARQTIEPQAEAATDLLQILMMEHKAAHELFLKLERIGRSGAQTGDQRVALMSQLKFELTTHNELEERLFYPLLQEPYNQRALLQKAFEQHHEADALLVQLEQAVLREADFLPTLQELMRGVLAHVDLEENMVHPIARQELTPARREELGRQFLQDKKQRKREAGLLS